MTSKDVYELNFAIGSTVEKETIVRLFARKILEEEFIVGQVNNYQRYE
jgi:hypothetical protein